MNETRIGPYLILRLIKTGGQGSVYLGYDRRLERQVAIKIHSLPPGRTARQRVLAEARRVASINDPRVVQIYDLVEARGYLAVVMEYVPGCDLQDFLRRGRPSVASALRIGADLAAALAAATLQDVVHGDLKPANVLLTTDGRAKLTDFGLGRRSGGRGIGDGGTPGALSPEHVRGQPLQLQSDLFCLGCLLYRMLAGVSPYARGGRSEFEALLQLDPVPLQEVAHCEEGLPQPLLALVGELLQRDPQRRPADTHRVRSMLRSAMREIPLGRADTLLVESRPFFRRESGTDIPPRIPSRLRHGGRSRLAPRFPRHWLQRSIRWGVPGLAAVVLLLLVASTLQREPARVHFEPPLVELPTSVPVAPGLDGDWLMRTVFEAVESSIGPLQASGSAQSPVYYAGLASGEAEDVIATSLRCSDLICVFFVSRDSVSGYSYRQALIPPQVPRPQWESAVTQAVAALFP